MKSQDSELLKYPFIKPNVARELHIFDVLDEISRQQTLVLAGKSAECSTLESLKKSNNIDIPFTQMREKTIIYLLNLLVRTYPEDIKTILSFRFSAEPQTKKMSIEEITEYTVLMNYDEFNTIMADRDKKSAESLKAMLAQYKFFNLTKLQLKIKGKNHFARILTSEIGENIFIFKYHSRNKNDFEVEEDYCFHKQNYPSVVESIKIKNIQRIISTHSNNIMTRLKKFGILNTTVTDYRDNKLDYLINILLNDISSFLGAQNLDEVKNFASLRTCLLEIDRKSDPLLVLDTDIATYIRNHDEIVTKNELLEVFDTLTSAILVKWAEEKSAKNKIITYKGENSELYFIDYANFIKNITSLNEEILLHQNEFANPAALTQQEKIKSFKIMNMIGRQVLASSELTKEILNNDKIIDEMRHIINEFDEFQRRLNLRNKLALKQRIRRKKKSFLSSIFEFFLDLFRKSRPVRRLTRKVFASDNDRIIRVTSETLDIYEKIIKSTLPIIPLSNYIDISPNNNITVNLIINKLRSADQKIVIPIYDARKNLYPSRSKKYLMADVEYILVNPGVIKSRDTIRNFTRSIQGISVKEEPIPVSAIIQIEKYLLTLQGEKK